MIGEHLLSAINTEEQVSSGVCLATDVWYSVTLRRTLTAMHTCACCYTAMLQLERRAGAQLISTSLHVQLYRVQRRHWTNLSEFQRGGSSSTGSVQDLCRLV